jgi:hypothetical protein
VNGDEPIATTVNEALPDVEQILLSEGCVPIVAATQVEVTVTVKVKLRPTHDPDVGVTV